MQSFGFNTVIVSNNNFSDDSLRDMYSFLCQYGFRKIIFTLDQDVSSATVSQHVFKKKLMLEKVKKFSPRGVYSDVVSNVLMTNDAVYEKQISRLSLKKSQYLLFELPIFDGEDWIDSSLNYLLYKQKKKLLFISFDKNIITYSPDFVEHLIHTRLSAFMLDMNSLTNPTTIPYVKKLIDANAIIIPGLAGVLDDYSNLFDKFEFLQRSIGKNDYAKMIINASRGCRMIFE